jgi:hypothetical protein
MEQEAQESEYEAPEIEDIGDLVDLTAGHAHGHPLDPLHPMTDHPSFSS